MNFWLKRAVHPDQVAARACGIKRRASRDFAIFLTDTNYASHTFPPMKFDHFFSFLSLFHVYIRFHGMSKPETTDINVLY